MTTDTYKTRAIELRRERGLPVTRSVATEPEPAGLVLHSDDCIVWILDEEPCDGSDCYLLDEDAA